jgi:hypothetical protein
MRSIYLSTALAALFFAANTFAENVVVQDKIKTGILPSGGLYSIYEVNCADSSNAHIATLDRRRNWCMVDGANIDCFRTPQLAAERACAAQNLELAGDGKSTSPDA